MIHTPISVRGNQEKQALPTFLPKAQKNLKSCFFCSSPPDLLCNVLNIVSTIWCPEYHLILSSQSTSLFSFYKGDWGTEKLSNLTKVRQLGIGRAGIWSKALPVPKLVLLSYFSSISCAFEICVCFCCSSHLKDHSCCSYLFSQSHDKNFPYPPSYVSYKGFLKPPIGGTSPTSELETCLTHECYKTSSVGWLDTLALKETHHLNPWWDTLNLQTTPRRSFLTCKRGKMKQITLYSEQAMW